LLPPRFTLFPYTTLFRSDPDSGPAGNRLASEPVAPALAESAAGLPAKPRHARIQKTGGYRRPAALVQSAQIGDQTQRRSARWYCAADGRSNRHPVTGRRTDAQRTAGVDWPAGGWGSARNR